MYASSPLSSDPNTINICKAADFEISDDPWVAEGRCHVPLAEGGNPNMYILYLMSSNQAAAVPSVGSVVPQTSGPWSTVLNAGSIPVYNQANFPPPTGAGVFNSFSITTPGQYAVIAVLCTLNTNNQYEIVTANAGSPVSDKVFINFLDTNQPLAITGEQFLCNTSSYVYSIPGNLTGFNPTWTVTGGTIIGSGTSVQVNWTTPFTGQRSISVHIQLNEGQCEQTAQLLTYDCCTENETNVLNVVKQSLSSTLFSGLGFANPLNSRILYVYVNDFFHIDENIQFDSIYFKMGPQAKITVADNVHAIFSNCHIVVGCDYMYDGLYANNTTQSIEFYNVIMQGAINGLVSQNGGRLKVSKSDFQNNMICIQVKNYNPTTTPTYNGNSSPLDLYDNLFLTHGGFFPPYAGAQQAIAAIKVENSGFVEIGNRNQLSNKFNEHVNGFHRSMPTAILMLNSGGNIVNNTFYKNDVVGSPSQVGAIVASNSSHPSWLAPLQIGRLWVGGDPADANHFDVGYQAIRTTNVRSVFIIDNTFKNYGANITVVNASNNRVIQGNKINYQLGSVSVPNRSTTGIVVSSTHGVPTSGGAIWDNHIEACMQSILLNTVNTMTVSGNVIRTFTAPGASETTIRAGISATNGWNLIIRQNDLVHNNMPKNDTLTGHNLRGISLNNVVDAFVWDNSAWRYGSGIYAANDNRVSQFRCNFLVSSVWGFNFKNVYLDQQGNPGDPTDNQWVGNRRAIRTNGTEDLMPTTFWYYRSGNEFSPFALPVTIVATTPQLTTGNEVECSNVILPGDTTPIDKYEDPEVIEDVFGAVVDSSVQFSSAAVQYFEESMTYRILDQNPAIIQQTSMRQQAFNDFYTAHYTGSKGDVKRLYDALLDNSTADVEQSLSALQPNNTFETKIAEVSAIYAQSWAKGRFELDSSERSVLLPIAQADAHLFGEAVYTARVMLGMFDLDGNIGAANLRRALNEEVTADVIIGAAYPNPTKGSFSFAGSVETGMEKAEVRLYDLQGRLMATPKTYFADGVWQVANPNLNVGMYLYRFYIDGAEVQHGKIVIQ